MGINKATCGGHSEAVLVGGKRSPRDGSGFDFVVAGGDHPRHP